MQDGFLSQDEVDALLKGIDDEDVGSYDQVADPNEVRSFNLANQERIVRGSLPTLEIIHERFIRMLRVSMFNFLRRTTEVSVTPIRTMKYGEFVRNLVVPTNLNLIHIKPLRGTALIVCDPTLVFSVVDCMFGGDGRFHTRVEGRDFTQTEQRIIRRVLDLIFEAYQNSWAPVYELELEYLRSELNTQFANICTPNEVVVTASFTIEVGVAMGQIDLCIPYSMIEPIKDLLASTLQGETLGADERWVKMMRREIMPAELELVANLCTKDVNVASLLEMKVGDVIPLNLSQEIEVTVENLPVLACRYGTSNGQYALRVEKLLKFDSNETARRS